MHSIEGSSGGAAPGLFITGTDTGVGKTHVTASIASVLSRRVRVGVMKPAESGCHLVDGQLYPADAGILQRASGSFHALELICPYRFHQPISPSEAARISGVSIEISRIIENFEKIRNSSDVVLVEGAGGLLAPLFGRVLFGDLAAVLGLPVLVVARPGLGTVNHTLLTVEAAKSRSLKVAGIVLNEASRSADDPSIELNAAAIRELTGLPIFGPLPFKEDVGNSELHSDVVTELVRQLFGMVS